MLLSLNSIFLGDLVFFINEIFFFSLIIILLCFSLYFYKFVKSLELNKLIIELALPFIVLNLIFIYFLIGLDLNFLFHFKLDIYFISFKLILFLFLFLCLIFSKNYFFLEKMNMYEYLILILLSIQGISLILMSQNLVVIYIAIEIQNLCFYVLASLKRYNNFSTEAGLKYFLFGSFSSSLVLFGISLLYGFFGTVNILDLYFIVINYNNELFFILFFLAIFFFLSGLLFKLGSVPFHWWIPDVYEGSPTIIMLFFSIIPKILLLFLLVKLYFYFFFFELRLNIFFYLLGFLSIIIGGLNAMFQYKIKRFLAYSTIANIGFILIGYSIFNIEGMFSSLFYLICYVFSVLLFFIIFLIIKKYKNIEFNKLFELSNLNFNWILIFFISFIFFSFIGLPPFMGFFGKFLIYFYLYLNFNYFILSILLIFSIIVGFYYLRVIRFLFFSFFLIENKLVNYNNFSNLVIILFLFNLFFLLFFDFIGENLIYILLNYYLFF